MGIHTEPGIVVDVDHTIRPGHETLLNEATKNNQQTLLAMEI